MKFLRKCLDKIKPTFEKDGKFKMFRSTFEAFESFLFVPNTTAKSGAHIRDINDLKRTMSVVIVALMPALLFGMWNVGYQHHLATAAEMTFWSMFWFGFLKVLPIIIVTYVVGLGIEFASAQIRGHEVNEGFLVTGILIPMIMPIDCPLWMIGLATAFAVIIGKEVFGGTGMNIFNPALLARAFVFFAYPSHISGNKVWVTGLSANEG
ncbi:MAG: RnfABCDGE type electron transport complex subunit D, partial [Prevotellaceae bacterium]|nr:RnfABCDGE type electron transport complex subunit D [Prevotellaceae bacterium]